jgi:predicted dehydrogenase
MTVRWGILGTGGIAQTFADALDRTDGATLAGVASRDGQRANAFASAHEGAVGFGSYEGLLQSPDIDVVYIATPQHRHAEDALAVLAHGKHALIEKPLVLDSASAEAIAAAAAKSGLIALEGMWTLFNPLVLRMLAEVDSGRLGALRSFTANTGPIGVPVGHRALTPELGASLLWECLVYPVAILVAVDPAFADPTHIHAVSLMREKNFDDASAVLLATASAFAQFGGSFSAGSTAAATSTVQLGFENGWVELSEIYSPNRLRIGWANGTVVEFDADADGIGFGYEIDAVCRAIAGVEPLPDRVGLAATVGNVALLERIRSTALALG